MRLAQNKSGAEARSAELFVLPGRKDEAWRYSNHQALQKAQGWSVDVPAVQNVVLEGDSRTDVTFSADLGQSFHPFLQIGVEKGANAVLFHRFEGKGWLNARLQIDVTEAGLHHIIVQDRELDAVTTVQIDVTLGKAGHYHLHVLQTGSEFGRVALDTLIQGEGAHLDVHAAQLAVDGQNLEIVTRTTHEVPHTSSNQIVRNVLRGRSVASYLGKIKVERGAQKTDAEQNARSLLLDRTATANTKPELEIYADDVKCAHGAAIGELDEKALFYLMARGIAYSDARALLIEAFVGDVLGDIPDETVQNQVMARAHDWMQGGEP